MKNRTFLASVCGVLISSALALSQAYAAKLDTRWMELHAKVAVDANGRVTDVALIEDKMSAAVKAIVVNNLKNWQFVPVLANGVAAPAMTYVRFDACAIPSGDGYDLAVRYVDNGPLLDWGRDLEWSQTIDRYANDHQSINIKLRIATDGRAELQDVVMIDVPPTIQRDIRFAVKDWVRTLHYEPEQIAGQPVATDIEWPMELVKRMTGVRYGEADAAADPACKAAREAMEKPRSTNSPLKLRDSATPQDAATPAK